MAQLQCSQEEAAHVAAIATHLSRLRVSAPRVWLAVGDAALACLAHAQPAEVVGVLAAHSRAGVPHKLLFERASTRVASSIHDAQPQDVATLLWALARAGHPLSRTLLRATVMHLESHAGRYSLLHLASIAGACSSMGVRDGELRRLLLGRGTEALHHEATAWVQPTPEWVGTEAAAPPPSVRAAASLVLSLCALGPPTPELLKAAAAALAKLLDRATAAGGVHVSSAELDQAGQVATLLEQAGHVDEHNALVQACNRLRHLLGGLEEGLAGFPGQGDPAAA
ncbi:hypothetical protein TSOC_003973 [Tetrabaena socialis]|uniref:Uncharacterized protein n=1 Tax=Tetrabaena socialis TaxID=47790 RepID=A0A2J8AA51_9CHLO|nr:hypothetical protein TSOC_003973 [Tetrabaena socialis]|eukprot:PNH09402.1 hypothetical protein TSOC_003973 [Tetrabaena socialis]